MPTLGQNMLETRRSLNVAGKSYDYFSIPAAASAIGDVARLPYCLKVLLENMLRYQDGSSVKVEDVKQFKIWLDNRRAPHEIAYRPGRVLMQDFSGVPAVVDLAAMRDAIVKLGGDPQKINPLSTVDLVIDHSVMADSAGTEASFDKNVELEFERNKERYEFLRWGATAFRNFRVVPPGTGICHQVNTEYLAQVVWTDEVDGKTVAYPDTLVGTDSHTTMINGLAVLGWGVGGIEAEAAMLGQPVSMLIPEVVGFKLTGKLKEGSTSTDLVLRVVEMLRQRGVVGKFVEFYGDGLDALPLPDRATIANMTPEFGATCGFFPIDAETIRYLNFTGRDEDRIALVEAYAKAQGMWREKGAAHPIFTDTLELDMGSVQPALAGPKRPQDRVLLSDAATAFIKTEADLGGGTPTAVAGADYSIEPGHVTLAAITSCTNTSNPPLLITAGLLAQKANALGLRPKPWVKTSFAPGSQVVQDYLEVAGLQDHLDNLGFNIIAFGCTTCIGNSGPFEPGIALAIDQGDILVGAVVSSNRNFEGRVHPQVRANYLASPPLVIAYALAGSMKADLLNDPLGRDADGNNIYMKDIWPTPAEVADVLESSLTPQMFKDRYSNVFLGPEQWQKIHVSGGETYDWSDGSTYVQNPPYFEGMKMEVADIADIHGARSLAKLGDSITTDHISPASSIKRDSPAGEYLLERQVRPVDFNSYGSRRGNHQVMIRGTFGNTRIKNELVPGIEGGVTKHQPSGEIMPIFDAAKRYREEGTSLIIIGGKEYGTGSSRDWAAKGTNLLGVSAVIVESFERIHRSNLVGMGVLPLEFKDSENRETLNLDGTETFDITGIAGGITPRMDVPCTVHRADGSSEETTLLCRIDTEDEVAYYKNGGILHYVLRKMMQAA